MAYVAVKPCRFAGQSFRIGEIVPVDALQPGAAKNLVKMGVIAEGEPDAAKPTAAEPELVDEIAIRINIHDMPLDVTVDGLQAIFDVLSSTASEAEKTIQEMTDEDALILLNACDSRKSIKSLTEERAKALLAEPEGEESEGEL